MQPIRDSQKPHNELPPSVKRHGQMFPPSAQSRYMVHESPSPWTITLPAVGLLLGVRSAIKELLGRSAAEMIY